MSDVKIWMPFYISDYVADTGGLCAAEHGAYLMLIFHYWRTGCPISAENDDAIRRIAKMEKNEWKKSRETVLSFFQLSDGFYYHKRIDEEMLVASGKRDKSKARAAAAAAARWSKDDATSIPQAMREDVKNNARAMPYIGEGECASGKGNSTVSKIGTTSSDGDEWGAK